MKKNYLQDDERKTTPRPASDQEYIIKVTMPDERLAAVETSLHKVEARVASDIAKRQLSDSETKKVEVTNQPDVQKVEVTNPTPPPVITTETVDVTPLLQAIQAVAQELQKVQSVEVTNQPTPPAFPTSMTIANLPTGKGDVPRLADPTNYVNVRMTDGTSFYKALDQMLMAGGSGGGLGKPWTPSPFFGAKATVQQLSTQAARFGGYFIYNPNASVAYLQVFNAATASDVTLGTTAPVMTYGIPATAGANVEFSRGVQLSLGVQFAFTTGANNSTPPSTGLDGFLLLSDV